MQLEQFALEVSKNFTEQNDLDNRMKFAEAIAADYRFKCPALVLFYTHPKLSRLSVPQRCKEIGITEEQYIIFAKQEGFQRFLKELHTLNLSTMRTQAMDSVGKALESDRYTYDRDGNEMINHQLEVEIMRGLTQERQGPSVAVQVNNLWGAARQRQLERKK